MKIQMRATTLVALSLVTTLGCNSVPKIKPVEIPLISQDKDIQKQETCSALLNHAEVAFKAV